MLLMFIPRMSPYQKPNNKLLLLFGFFNTLSLNHERLFRDFTLKKPLNFVVRLRSETGTCLKKSYSLSQLNLSFWSVIGILCFSQIIINCPVPTVFGFSKSSIKMPKLVGLILSVPMALMVFNK